MSRNLNAKAKNALMLGTLCTLSYLAVYAARNILGTTSPQIEAAGVFDKEILGVLSSIYFTCYACGQQVNGLIGNRVKAKYMMSFGLAFARICTLLFPLLSASVFTTYVIYGATGFLVFMSYMAAAASSSIFAGAVGNIGWSGLILVWFGLMVIGVIVALPYGKILKKAA